MLPTHRNSLSLFVLAADACYSFVRGRQGSRLSENGGDGSSEGFMRASMATEFA